MKRAVLLGWAVGAFALGASALGALGAPPPAPEGLSCWRDAEHDVWPGARVLRDGLRLSVVRTDPRGGLSAYTDGVAVLGGSTVLSNTGRTWFRGDRLFLDGAPYRRASCAFDRAASVAVDVRHHTFAVSVAGGPAVPVGPAEGPCLLAPPYTDRLALEVVCARGSLGVFRRADGLEVVNHDEGDVVRFPVPGIPLPTFAEDLPRLQTGPLRLARTDGTVLPLGGDERDCVPTDPGFRPGAWFNCLGGGDDRVEELGVRLVGDHVQVTRERASGAVAVVTTPLGG